MITDLLPILTFFITFIFFLKLGCELIYCGQRPCYVRIVHRLSQRLLNSHPSNVCKRSVFHIHPAETDGLTWIEVIDK